MSEPSGDQFHFHGATTLHGPAAFGSQASAWSGPADAAWSAQLSARIAEFSAELGRYQPMMDGSDLDRIRQALAEVTAALRSERPDRAGLAARIGRLVAAASTVSGLALAADRLRELTSG